MKNQKNVLLTWDAYNNGFVVTASTAMLLKKDHEIEIDEIIYLHDRNLQSSTQTEIDLFYGKISLSKAYDTISDDTLKERFKMCRVIGSDLRKLPKYRNKNVTIKNVTDYQSIFDGLANLLKSEFYNLKDTMIHINVSPGTPQMHVVWLMLNASGYLPVYTKLWSSQWIREKKRTELTEIKFTPKTYLSSILSSKFLISKSQMFDPNLTKSKQRKNAEIRLALYSQIPDASIMLIGERGTGKSTYVRKLKTEMEVKGLPYEELACGIFSEELMRSELFGHKKGSFTGAVTDKEGILSKFKVGGILFLDEIHDLSKALQNQLMQVLQTGEYYPVGSEQVKKAVFNLVTASNISIREMLTDKMDVDFFDRISRFIIEIPPLRNCREDLQSDWEDVWKEIGNFNSPPKPVFNEKLFEFINNDPLDGNFRDLQVLASYVIAYLFEFKNEDSAVNKAILEYSYRKDLMKLDTGHSYFIKNETHNRIVAYFEKDLAEWAVRTYGSISEAARILDRSEDMLRKYIKLNRLKNLSTE